MARIKQSASSEWEQATCAGSLAGLRSSDADEGHLVLHSSTCRPGQCPLWPDSTT